MAAHAGGEVQLCNLPHYLEHGDQPCYQQETEGKLRWQFEAMQLGLNMMSSEISSFSTRNYDETYLMLLSFVMMVAHKLTNENSGISHSEPGIWVGWVLFPDNCDGSIMLLFCGNDAE